MENTEQKVNELANKISGIVGDERYKNGSVLDAVRFTKNFPLEFRPEFLDQDRCLNPVEISKALVKKYEDRDDENFDVVTCVLQKLALHNLHFHPDWWFFRSSLTQYLPNDIKAKYPFLQQRPQQRRGTDVSISVSNYVRGCCSFAATRSREVLLTVDAEYLQYLVNNFTEDEWADAIRDDFEDNIIHEGCGDNELPYDYADEEMEDVEIVGDFECGYTGDSEISQNDLHNAVDEALELVREYSQNN